MAVDTVPDFMELLRDNRLLDSELLEALNSDFLASFADARTLAKYLRDGGWLTAYQVNQLLRGNAQDLVLGPYRILDRLGEGGVSDIFKAWDVQHRCVVALKVVREEHLFNPEAMGRFQRELRAVAQLSHPNIIKAYDTDHMGNRPYFAMEYVRGMDLGKLVQLSGPLPVAKACDYIRQAALGVQHAHECGLVHRDIKPGNLFLTKDGSQVKVLDLGLARFVSTAVSRDGAQTLTHEGSMIGTPDYVSPEQARSPRTADSRADIYSLGCTLYYLLTGQPPFPDRSVMDKLLKHQQAEPAPVDSLRADVPAGLAGILANMLAKHPDDRYQTAAEVAEALASYTQTVMG